MYSRLKPNNSRCEIPGIGVLKGVLMELCGIECIDLTNNSVKTLDSRVSYNKKIEMKRTLLNLLKKSRIFPKFRGPEI